MMRSRPARLTLCALAWIALGAAAFYTIHTQSQIDERREAFHAFELSARDASDALQDVQAGEQAYVAAGQDTREWTTKVSAYLKTASGALDALKGSALNPASKVSIQDATTAFASMTAIDRRLRGQIGQGEFHQAADVVFSEANDTAASAEADVESALDTERQAADSFEAGRRQARNIVLGLVAALVASVVGLLGLFSFDAFDASPSLAGDGLLSGDGTIRSDLAYDVAMLQSHSESPLAEAFSTELLNSVSELCAEFGRVRSADELRPLLQQSATLMGARGLIVWLGDTAGSDLRPVLAYGYSESTLARLSTVPRRADNAAADAYRTGDVQIVASRAGGSLGAIVAPLLSADGCIGALTAEIRERGDESTDDTRALAVIVASQLSSVLAAAASASAAAPVAAPAPASDIERDAAAG